MIFEFKAFGNYTKGLEPNYVESKPFINEIYASETSYLSTHPEDYTKVMKYVKKSPECLAIFNAIATDIASDGVYFIPYKKQGKKTNIEKAEDFLRKNDFKSQFKAGLIDWLMFGNCGFWMGISQEEMKEMFGKRNIEFKEEFYDQFSDLTQFQHVAWSTMFILHDFENITGYRQTVGTGGQIVNQYGREIEGKRSSIGVNTKVWKPDSIIHGRFMSFDGKVYGYTPTFSLMPVLSTLALLKDYCGNYFENGGVPDWMFILPSEIAGSPNIKRLEQMLQDYKRSTQKHGNMIIPGDVKAEALNAFDKDMEFRKLAVYYTSVLAFAFNMPMGRLQSILGMENKGKDSDIASESYWRTVSEAQDYFEDLLNVRLFIPYFNVEMRFNKTYKQDEVRESQNLLFLQNYAEGMNRILSGQDKKLSATYLKRIFKLKDEDLEEGANMSAGPQLNQNFQTNEQLTGNNQQMRNQKKTEQERVLDKKKGVVDAEIKKKELDLLEKKEKIYAELEKQLGKNG